MSSLLSVVCCSLLLFLLSAVLGVGIVRSYQSSINGVKAHVEGLAVLEPARGRGVGRALLNAIKVFASSRGALELTLQVSSQNARAMRFFGRERLELQCLAFRGPSAKTCDSTSQTQLEKQSQSLVTAQLANGSGNADEAASFPSPTIEVPANGIASAAASLCSASTAAALPVHAGFSVFEVSDPNTRTLLEEHVGLLRLAGEVHRQLRGSRLPEGDDAYIERMSHAVADGAQILLAVARRSVTDSAAETASPSAVLGICVLRHYRDLTLGGALVTWIDDLVSDSQQRSQGVGAAMIALVRAQSRIRGIATFALDSGVQRHAAHRFYFREQMCVDAFSFGGLVTDVLTEIASVQAQA